MALLFVSSNGVASAALVLYSAREGDTTITIEQDGFSEDVEPLLYGYLRTMSTKQHDCCGLVWDEQRYLTFIGGDVLSPSSRWHLSAAGFTIPEGY